VYVLILEYQSKVAGAIALRVHHPESVAKFSKEGLPLTRGRD